MTTPFAMERLLLHAGVPRLHTATRPPQLNPTVTGPQSRCDPCNSTSDDEQAEADFEVIEVRPSTDDGETDEMSDVSSIFSDIDDIEDPNPYLFYVIPLTEEPDDEDDEFILVIPYQGDNQPSLSTLLERDQIYPWASPTNPDPYHYLNQDDVYTDHSDSVPSSMVNSAILGPYDFTANREGSGEDMLWSMSMSSSSITSSRMNCSGRNGSASLSLKYAGTYLDDLVDGHMEGFPDILGMI
ncbi:hypothetical protein AJ78_00265 [Emergomyces pasteurianus Ep9510]|uniref:Uncharacterized protein n=1 Tax=Emergomyces pasteurianus Ep9510 TaxID=1447872 RepID=A0A1J9PU34_9EURO|nr:hypothetical protein AJ78_00265 [Emergomyces pasteurianus Ep9510]